MFDGVTEVINSVTVYSDICGILVAQNDLREEHLNDFRCIFISQKRTEEIYIITEFWTFPMVRYSRKQKTQRFRDWWGGKTPIQLGPFERANLNYSSQGAKLSRCLPLPHLRTETDPLSETSCFLFSRIPDDGRRRKVQEFCVLFTIVRIIYLRKYILALRLDEMSLVSENDSLRRSTSVPSWDQPHGSQTMTM
jgi:hypothetical protein